MSFTCRICGGEAKEDTAISVLEMMYGTREEFSYIECPHCHTLQIVEIPKDIGRYYGENYYSYSKISLPKLDTSANKDLRAILDVGCGSGKFLMKLYQEGAKNLTGCDPYLSKEIHYAEGFHIYNKSIHEMTGQYDLIYMNDSFEHVTDPHEVMDSLKRLLSPDGHIEMTIPVFPNLAYQEFGAFWYEIDAPRHIHLFSKEALQILAQNHNLEVTKVIYNSTYRQIVCSYLYKQGIPYIDQTPEVIKQYFSDKDLEQLNEMSVNANVGEIGDHAKFYLSHDT